MRSNKSGMLAILLTALSSAPTAGAIDLDNISHCAPTEIIFFSCEIGKKVVSVCALKNRGGIARLSYRYGTLGEIENEYVASEHNQHRFFGTTEPLTPRATVEQIWYVAGDMKYLLTVCTGGDCSQTAGLAIFRRHRMLASNRCRDDRKNPPWFSRDVVDFGGDFESSKSNTKMLIIMDADNNLGKIYSTKMHDLP
jgi:hypothetical protein